MSDPATPDNPAANPAAVPGAEPPSQPTQPAARPEHIPEKFWDSEGGQVRTEDLAKSYAGLESLVGQRVTQLDDVQKQLLAESFPDAVKAMVGDALKADEAFITALLEERRPKAPDSYEVKADLLPEGVKGIDTENAVFKAAVDFGKEHGFSQEQFDAILKMGLDLMPVPQALEVRMAEVGPDFQARAAATKTAARSAVSADQHALIASLEDALESPEEFRGYEALVKAASRETKPPEPKVDPVDPKLKAAELDNLVKDPRYKTDPVYRATVDRKFQEFYDRGETL